jgi:flagellar protein FliO/FliZ
MKYKHGLRLAAFTLGGWLMTVGLAAAEPPDISDTPDIGSPGIGYLIWVIVALMLVIGLIILLIKWLSARNRGWGSNRALRSLGGIPLGPNKSLQVVELSGRIYVVGVGDSVTLLDKIEDTVEASAVLKAIEQQNGSQWNGSSFADLLNRFRNRGQDSQPTSEPWQAAASFQEMLQDKMKRQSVQKQKVEDLLKEQNHNDRLLDE